MSTIEQRRAYRFPTDLEADCRMSGQAWSARLHNISTSGCMMACPEGGLPEGSMMRLRIRGLQVIDAEIVWRHRGHAGLRFMQPLQTNSLEHLGYHLPDGARPCLAGSHEPAGLNAALVKRMATGNGVPVPASPRA
ncbi:hypothetical protein GRI89_00975 [Altererythrobacter salegens]|uniref:PilZ domain-containing protein n=1 Tax=Croceibacterium salegens TaxID=1737568 RepID=A0A6I4SR95_9SPHN|nr:PilZ domain-containing protein [Croceibacterium salegens]MXO58119.1 hypothetical protein [Croceibacterium salegens]